MKTSASKELAYNIEDIWELLSDDQLIQEIDPKVILNEPIELTNERIGSTYRQQYKEGKKVKEYIVTVTDYSDRKSCKKFSFTFDLDKLVHIDCTYTLKAVTHKRTKLTYEVNQQALSFGTKVMFKLMPKSVIDKQTKGHIDIIDSLLAKRIK